MRVIAALLSALAVVACSPAAGDPDASPTTVGDISMITVGQSDTYAPTLEFVEGLEFEAEETTLLWDGDGAALVSGQPLLLHLYGESLADGTPVVNTFDGQPSSFVLTPEIIGESLHRVLSRAHVGARVLTVSPPADDSGAEPAVAMVVDVLSERAVGESSPSPAGMPDVELSDTGEPTVIIGDDVLPTGDLQVATLIQGGGFQVGPTSRVTANVVAAYLADGESEQDGAWSAGEVFESSWPVERAPVMIDMSSPSTLPGLQQGLLDQTSGSQVLIVVPPTLGYPTRGTVVFVVDILDVWTPED